MDTLILMQAFAKVVETGGLSAAGRALGLAPSSVSRRIGELEDHLGVRLLQRTTRKISLTEAGSIYYERSKDIVQAVEEANLAVTEKRTAPAGLLRITAPASVARSHIAPAIAAFRARYGGVRIGLSVTDRMVDLVGEGFDVAIRIGRLEDSSMIARKVGEVRRLVCAGPSYLRDAGTPQHPSELADHDCLTFRRQPGPSVWRFRDGADVVDVPASGPLYCDDGETLVAAARAGMGTILVPEWLVGAEIGNGRLVELLGEYVTEPATTPLYAVFSPGPFVAPKVRAFVDFLADRFSGAYGWGTEH